LDAGRSRHSLVQAVLGCAQNCALAVG
jgi:hypothetical protein